MISSVIFYKDYNYNNNDDNSKINNIRKIKILHFCTEYRIWLAVRGGFECSDIH